jgi:uncharacterized protein YrrD
MPKPKALNIAAELCGLPVLDPETARLHGKVVEAIIHPTEGTLLSLWLQAPGGAARAVAGADCQVFRETGAILAPQQAVIERQKLAPKLASGLAVCRGLLGASVVTEEGELLGRVTEAYLHEERQQISYRITKSKLQELWGGGFFLAGHVPLTWSSLGARLIVPADTASKHARASLQAVFTTRPEPSKKGAYQWASN